VQSRGDSDTLALPAGTKSVQEPEASVGSSTVAALQKDTIRPQRETVGRIFDTDRPKTKKACRSLLGMINFYRRYIPNCAEIIAPQPQRKFGL